MRAPEPPLGEPVEFASAPRPHRCVLRGRHVTLRPLQPREDAPVLYRLSHGPDGDSGVWRYLPYGPYGDALEFETALEERALSEDPLFFAAVPDAAAVPQGVMAYLRITPEHGCIEIGHIWFGPPLQRTAAATETVFLLARHALDELGYRRLEWKCNALNAASRRAAERFGFVFEGVFAQHMVVKGRNRDTAWYAITDRRWPVIRRAFEAWLQPENFDGAGAQRRALGEFMPPPA